MHIPKLRNLPRFVSICCSNSSLHCSLKNSKGQTVPDGMIAWANYLDYKSSRAGGKKKDRKTTRCTHDPRKIELFIK
jgi:hypothetical protein